MLRTVTRDDINTWVESTEGESEEGGRAKDTMEGWMTGTRQGGPRPSRWLWCNTEWAIPSTIKGESRLIQDLGTERKEWPTRELWNAQRSHMSERVTGITGGPRGQSLRGNEPRSTVQICRTRRHPVPRGSPPKAVEGMGAGEGRSRLKWRG